METAMNTTMTARVLCLECGCRLLVCDCAADQQVLVHTSQARCFSPGDLVCIEYNGIMTASLPPQISAQRIWRACC